MRPIAPREMDSILEHNNSHTQQAEVFQLPLSWTSEIMYEYVIDVVKVRSVAWATRPRCFCCRASHMRDYFLLAQYLPVPVQLETAMMCWKNRLRPTIENLNSASAYRDVPSLTLTTGLPRYPLDSPGPRLGIGWRRLLSNNSSSEAVSWCGQRMNFKQE